MAGGYTKSYIIPIGDLSLSDRSRLRFAADETLALQAGPPPGLNIRTRMADLLIRDSLPATDHGLDQGVDRGLDIWVGVVDVVELARRVDGLDNTSSIAQSAGETARALGLGLGINQGRDRRVL